MDRKAADGGSIKSSFSFEFQWAGVKTSAFIFVRDSAGAVAILNTGTRKILRHLGTCAASLVGVIYCATIRRNPKRGWDFADSAYPGQKINLKHGSC